MISKITRAIQTSILLLFCLITLLLMGEMPVWAIDKAYYHLVILGDPHLPGKYISSKEKVIKNINTWTDVDEAIAIGDICEISGTNEEYATAKIFSKA